jgi:hypothetical protein
LAWLGLFLVGLAGCRQPASPVAPVRQSVAIQQEAVTPGPDGSTVHWGCGDNRQSYRPSVHTPPIGSPRRWAVRLVVDGEKASAVHVYRRGLEAGQGREATVMVLSAGSCRSDPPTVRITSGVARVLRYVRDEAGRWSRAGRVDPLGMHYVNTPVSFVVEAGAGEDEELVRALRADFGELMAMGWREVTGGRLPGADDGR